MVAKVLRVKNLTAEAASLPGVLYVNDMPLETDQDRRNLTERAITTYKTTDVLIATPSCGCGYLKEGRHIGVRCPVCKTMVTNPMSREITSDLWIRQPPEIGRLVTPLVWVMISKLAYAGKNQESGFNALQWFCDPMFQDPDPRNVRAMRMVEDLRALGIGRGYRAFVQNFDTVVRTFIHRDGNRKDSDAHFILTFLSRYRDVVFTSAIPLPNKIAFVVEETAVGAYYDATVSSCIEAIFTAANLSSERDLRKVESRFTTVMMLLSKYYTDVVNNTMSTKNGWLRRVVYGSRMNFSFRTIITSLHQPHDYLWLFVPYDQLLAMLIPQVMNKLVWERNWNYRDALDYIEAHASDSDPLLFEILEQLIDETPTDDNPNPAAEGLPSTLKTRERRGRGIGCTYTRYPSLDRGSTQYFRIVGITAAETRLSVLVLRAPNADFD